MVPGDLYLLQDWWCLGLCVCVCVCVCVCKQSFYCGEVAGELLRT